MLGNSKNWEEWRRDLTLIFSHSLAVSFCLHAFENERLLHRYDNPIFGILFNLFWPLNVCLAEIMTCNRHEKSLSNSYIYSL